MNPMTPPPAAPHAPTQPRELQELTSPSDSGNDSGVAIFAPSDVPTSPASTRGATDVERTSTPATPMFGLFDLNHTAAATEASTSPSSLTNASTKASGYDFGPSVIRSIHVRPIHERAATLIASSSSPSVLTSMVNETNSSPAGARGAPVVQGSVDDQGHLFTAHTALRAATTPENSSRDSYEKPNSNGTAVVTQRRPTYSPRQDRKGQMVTEDNAQAHYKPECCIFVANLPNTRTDEELYRAMIDTFSKFGECHVKLKRDRGMPIAFVQYHNTGDATTGLEEGSKLNILGRPCRTERAKAPRCIYVSRRDGTQPGEDEVSHLLEKSGELEKMWIPSETDREIHRLPSGVFVRFAYYQDAVEAVALLRRLPGYHVESHQMPKDQTWVFDKRSICRSPNERCTAPVYNPMRDDNLAIWVGDLPDTITKTELGRVFGGPGREVAHIDLRIRAIGTLGIRNSSYACIHYYNPRAAYLAAFLTHQNLRLLNGRMVRVQFARRTHPLVSPVSYNRYNKDNGFNSKAGGLGNRGLQFAPTDTYALGPNQGYLGNGLGYPALTNYYDNILVDKSIISYTPASTGPFGYYAFPYTGAIGGAQYPTTPTHLPVMDPSSFASDGNAFMS